MCMKQNRVIYYQEKKEESCGKNMLQNFQHTLKYASSHARLSSNSVQMSTYQMWLIA